MANKWQVFLPCINRLEDFWHTFLSSRSEWVPESPRLAPLQALTVLIRPDDEPGTNYE